MHCEICGCDLDAGQAVACRRCHSPFHEDCWSFNGGCGIFACGGKEHEPYRPAASSALVTIDESTRPPWRIAPLAEALIRRLPRWGRAVIPPLLFGLAGGGITLVVGAWVFHSWPPRGAVTTLLGASTAAALLAASLATWIRRRPLWCSLGFGAAAATLFYHFRVSYYPRSVRHLFIGAFIVASTIAASALVEALTGRRAAWLRLSPLARGIVRAVLTTLFVFLLFLGLEVAMGHGSPSTRTVMEIGVIALLALSVTAPPLELSKSALMHRLKAEAARQAEEEAQRLEAAGTSALQAGDRPDDSP